MRDEDLQNWAKLKKYQEDKAKQLAKMNFTRNNKNNFYGTNNQKTETNGK